ncbi:MAG: hypothetical protein JSR85_00180 [Proteobacteria bacterium]|nr:hypothetical protein [Pseudomonadota bacterium]
MKKTLLLTLLAIGCTSVSAFAKKITVCPTVAEIAAGTYIAGWDLDIQGNPPFHFDGANIKIAPGSNKEVALLTCVYHGTSYKWNKALYQLAAPAVSVQTCSFIIDKPEAKICPYRDPEKCVVYCSP